MHTTGVQNVRPVELCKHFFLWAALILRTSPNMHCFLPDLNAIHIWKEDIAWLVLLSAWTASLHYRYGHLQSDPFNQGLFWLSELPSVSQSLCALAMQCMVYPMYINMYLERIHVF